MRKIDAPGINKNYDVVCFSHLRWNFVFQRPQHLMVRWAKERRVFFVEEAIYDEQPLEELKIRKCSSGVTVVIPLLRSVATAETQHLKIRRLLEKMFTDEDIKNYVAWYYTPMALLYSKLLARSAQATVYDCMDELSNFKGASPELKILEKELFDLADVVFTGGYSLYAVKSKQHPNVHAFPSSVDVGHFAKARVEKVDPADQAGIPHPRLGFFGVIDERFDVDLIKTVAEERADWHIVLIGPVAKIDPASLPRLPNIHYLGQKNYEDIPNYLGHWDVALMPFAKNDATRFISPTKTPEYLAGGKPVVSTSIHDVMHPYGEKGLVHIADTPDDFICAVEKSLAEDRSEKQKEADAFLSRISWDRTWAGMKSRIDEHIRAKLQLECFDFDVPARSAKDGYDYLVVGAGFSGSVVAERLASLGNKVLICDKRPHVGGNAYDCPDEHGILIHKYGPHIFHTNSADVFNYLSNFTKWRPYEHRVLASVDDKLLPIPINLDTINRLYDWQLTPEQLDEYLKNVAEPRAVIRNSEDVIISKVGRELYEKFFRNYTRKQWGVDPSQLDASVIARIPVRTNRDDRYFTDTYQAMPLDGFTAMFENMLSHPNIAVVLGTDYQELINRVSFKSVVYTGPIDAFFHYCYGRLPYRSLQFKFETHDCERLQPVAVVNHPNDHPYTRVTEFKHLTGQKSPATSIVYEFPQGEGDPYYPIPCPQNYEIYKKYQRLAEATKNVHFAGRLATYKYYNMDQVAAQALTLASKIGGVDRKEVLSRAFVAAGTKRIPAAAARRSDGWSTAVDPPTLAAPVR
jgi:UDP-galactopyranose mutase